MDTGKRNRRATIVFAGEMTPDGLGGFTEGINTIREVWCSAKQLSMNEQLLYGLETSTASYRFQFLYYAADDVTRIDGIQYKGRNFRIKSIREIDEMRKVVEVVATELNI